MSKNQNIPPPHLRGEKDTTESKRPAKEKRWQFSPRVQGRVLELVRASREQGALFAAGLVKLGLILKDGRAPVEMFDRVLESSRSGYR